MRRLLSSVLVVVAAAAPAGAQQLKMSFADGLVSVDAAAVPVRTILTEWSKLGGTKVVGAERITGAPLTLKLVNVPEAQALDTILRSAAGYMAAPRGAGSGASIYDRILVLATSAAPPAPASRPSATAPAGPRPMAGTQRTIPPRFAPPDPSEQEEPEEEDEADEPSTPPVFTFPQPGQVGQPGANGAPIVTAAPVMGEAPTIVINPATPGSNTGAPGFGVVGAPVPGVIQQPPTPSPSTARPPQPGPMTRPPGGGV